MSSLLTIEAITKEALDVLEKGLFPYSQCITLTNQRNELYTFRLYEDGWELRVGKEVMESRLTDDEMFAHLKLLRS